MRVDGLWDEDQLHVYFVLTGVELGCLASELDAFGGHRAAVGPDHDRLLVPDLAGARAVSGLLWLLRAAATEERDYQRPDAGNKPSRQAAHGVPPKFSPPSSSPQGPRCSRSRARRAARVFATRACLRTGPGE